MITTFRVNNLKRMVEPMARHVVGTITHVLTRGPLAALTFDDGPDPIYTLRMLEVLERWDAHATFFMVGEAAARYPDIVRRVAAGGHAIGNHSWDHPSFPRISSLERREQIRACARAIAPYGVRLFRPPHGHQSLGSWFDTISQRHKIVGWSIAGHDWRSREPEWIAARLIGQIRPGAVLLLHDGLIDATKHRYFDRTPTVEAVRMFLERVRHQIRLVTLPELLRHGTPQRECWFRYPNPAFLNRLIRQGGQHQGYPEGAAGAGEASRGIKPLS